MLSSSDITRYANMPRSNVFEVDNVVREEFLKPIEDDLTFIENQYKELERLELKKTNLIIYGSDESVDITQSLESISDTVRSIWESIKAAFMRIMTWLGADSYFYRWTDVCKARLNDMEKLIQTREKFFYNVDADKFKEATAVGFTYKKYTTLLSTVDSLTRKINNFCTGDVVYENINIEQTFSSLIIPLGFSFRDGQMFEPSAMDVTNMNMKDLGWAPATVHSVTSKLHSILLNHLKTDRIKTTLSHIIDSSIKMCDENINSNSNSVNKDQLSISKKRLASMKCIRKIIVWDMSYISVMTRQWTTMVNKFVYTTL